MIAAQDDPCRVDVFPAGKVLDKGSERGGRHSSVAAVLIHLVAGGFDKDRVVAVPMGGQHSAECLRMGGAPGRDAARLAGAIVGDD